MKTAICKRLEKGLAGIILYLIIFTAACGMEENEHWEIIKNIQLVDMDVIMINMMGFINNKSGMAFSGDRFFITDDGGDSWEKMNRTWLPNIMCMDIIDKNTVVIGCTCASANLSEDKGKTWSVLNFPKNGILSFKDKNTGWGSSSSRLLTFNSGNFVIVQMPKEYFGNIIAIACISAEQVYILNREGKLSITTDSGATWKSVELKMNSGERKYNLFANGMAMRFSDLNNGMIIAYDTNTKEWTEFLTADGGKTWEIFPVVKAEGGLCFLSPDMSFITIRTTDYNRLILLQAKK